MELVIPHILKFSFLLEVNEGKCMFSNQYRCKWLCTYCLWTEESYL